MSEQYDLLWIGDAPSAATVAGALARALLPRLEQTHRLRVAALGWLTGAEVPRRCDLQGPVLLPPRAAWDAEAIHQAMAQFRPQVVVARCEVGQIGRVAQLLDDAGARWVPYVGYGSTTPRVALTRALRHAAVVIADSTAVAQALGAASGRPCQGLPLGTDPDCFRPLAARPALRRAVGLGEGPVVGVAGEDMQLAEGLQLLRWLAEARASGGQTALLLALEPQARFWQYSDYAKRLRLGASFREIGDVWQRSLEEGDAALNELLNLMDVLVLRCRNPETEVIAMAAGAAGVAVVSASDWLASDTAAALPHLDCPVTAGSLDPESLTSVLTQGLADVAGFRALQRAGRGFAIQRSWDDIAEQWYRLLAPLLSGSPRPAGMDGQGTPAAPRVPSSTRSAAPVSLPKLTNEAASFISFAGVLPADGTRRNVAILTPAFYSPTLACGGELLVMGGAERYLVDLMNLLQDRGYEVDAYQPSAEPWRRCYDGLKIYGLGVNGSYCDTRPAANRVFHEVTVGYGHLIYLAFSMCYPYARPGSIAVSHGLWWDIPGPEWWRSDEWRSRLRVCLEGIGTLVSVDTNTLNWVRQEWPDLSAKLRYLPNGVDVDLYQPGDTHSETRLLTVLFPRALVWGRGFGLMSEIARDLAATRHDLCFRFVGRGTADTEVQMRALVSECPRLQWEWRRFEGMPEVYRAADITVIPSLGSEGTSLSCLEAMACGNAVVATNVGGLSNLVIDGYNGILVEPDREAIREAILRLANDHALRKRLAERAVETARAFSTQRWRDAWAGVLDDCGLPARPDEEVSATPARLSAPVVLMVSLGPWGMTGGGQRPQKLAEALALRGFSVIYLQDYLGAAGTAPDGIRILSYADLVSGGLLGDPASLDEGARARLWRACRRVAEAKPAMALFSVSTPAAVALAREFKAHDLPVVYDVLDDWEAFAEVMPSHWYRPEADREMLQLANRVTAVSSALVERLSPNLVGLSPNAVDWRHVVAPRSPRPSDLPARGALTVGYVGSLSGEWHDWEVVARLAQLRPRWHVVLVGPGGEKLPQGLLGLPNVTVLPLKAHAEVPHYIDQFDVGLIPFKQDRLSAAVSPIKAYDYLARGCPVVSSPMSGLSGLPLVSVAESAKDWVPLIETAAEVQRHRPLRWLWENTWQHRVNTLTVGRLLSPTDGPVIAEAVERLGRTHRRPGQTALRLHWEMPDDSPYLCTYCGDGCPRRVRRVPLTEAQIRKSWDRFTEQYGACQVDVSGRDPLGAACGRRLLGGLAQTHVLRVESDLRFPIESVVDLKHPANVAFCACFDPSRDTAGELLERIRLLREHGFGVPWVRFHLSPRRSGQPGRWRDQFGEVGVELIGWRGNDSARDSRRRVNGADGDEPQSTHRTPDTPKPHLELPSPRGTLCATGWRYLVVRADGTICRCPEGPGDLGGLDFYDDECLVSDCASVCTFDVCRCEHAWSYQFTPREKLSYLGASCIAW
jgi:glycosyltransferase involved in cell wall biosynthesis